MPKLITKIKTLNEKYNNHIENIESNPLVKNGLVRIKKDSIVDFAFLTSNPHTGLARVFNPGQATRPTVLQPTDEITVAERYHFYSATAITQEYIDKRYAELVRVGNNHVVKTDALKNNIRNSAFKGIFTQTKNTNNLLITGMLTGESNVLSNSGQNRTIKSPINLLPDASNAVWGTGGANFNDTAFDIISFAFKVRNNIRESDRRRYDLLGGFALISTKILQSLMQNPEYIEHLKTTRGIPTSSEIKIAPEDWVLNDTKTFGKLIVFDEGYEGDDGNFHRYTDEDTIYYVPANQSNILIGEFHIAPPEDIEYKKAEGGIIGIHEWTNSPTFGMAQSVKDPKSIERRYEVNGAWQACPLTLHERVYKQKVL